MNYFDKPSPLEALRITFDVLKFQHTWKFQRSEFFNCLELFLPKKSSKFLWKKVFWRNLEKTHTHTHYIYIYIERERERERDREIWQWIFWNKRKGGKKKLQKSPSLPKETWENSSRQKDSNWHAWRIDRRKINACHDMAVLMRKKQWVTESMAHI